MSNIKTINPISYWGEANRALEQVGKYTSATKLKENLSDESTAWKVKGVFARYYDSSFLKLDQAIDSRKKGFFKSISSLNTFCAIIGFPEITKSEKLFELLQSEERRVFYRKEIKKCINSKTIKPLQDIELKYRGSSK